MGRRKVSYPGAGINFGHDIAEPYDPAVHGVDLQTIKAAGYRYVRVAMPSFDDAAWITKQRAIALQCLTLGLIPMYGITAGNPVDLTRWTAFLSAVNTEAAWAKANAVPFFLCGNEEELHVDGTTITWATAQANLRAKATAIKATGYTGKIVYASSQRGVHPNTLTWTSAASLGDIDLISWNVYANDGLFADNIQQMVSLFGPTRTMISEWNTAGGIVNYDGESDWARTLSDRWGTLQQSGLICCFFTWQWYEDYAWSLKTLPGTMRGAWQALAN